MLQTAAQIKLRNDLLDRVSEVDFQTLLAGEFKATGINAKLMQQRRVDVGDVVPIFDGVESNLIRRTMDNAAF